jgi:hypothetical protein
VCEGFSPRTKVSKISALQPLEEIFSSQRQFFATHPATPVISVISAAPIRKSVASKFHIFFDRAEAV